MKKFTRITSTAIPLALDNVDTDIIFPADFLTGISEKGHGKHLFQRMRKDNPDFPLNKTRFRKSRILIAGENFGCGSSREHAVWAIMDYGIRVVIAPSFADIFRNNSEKNGLLLICLPKKTIRNLIGSAQKNDLKLTINLESQTIKLPDGKLYKFPFNPFRKECFLKGVDDLSYIINAIS